MSKIEKTCIVCGAKNLKNSHASTCGSACRKKLSRLTKNGESPQFKILAKFQEKKQPTVSTPKLEVHEPEERKAPQISKFMQELYRKKLGLKD